MRHYAVLLVGAYSAGACKQSYTNKASTPILLCSRDNGGVPGARVSKLLQPGETFSEDCQVNKPYESHAMYFATRDTKSCQLDSGCTYGTCQHYPWWFGQGVSQQNGLWYGGIGINWDGDDTKHGWDGDYGSASAHYGLQLHCDTNKGRNTVDQNCTVIEGKPQCTPNVPAPHNSTNAGTAQCDATTIQINIIDTPCESKSFCDANTKLCNTPSFPVQDCSHGTQWGTPVCNGTCPVSNACTTVSAPCTPNPTCASDEYCCPDAKHCLKPAESPICTGAADCKAGEVCCPVTKECVKAGAACTSNCTSPEAYCCPDAKKCLTPVKPEVSCLTNSSACADGTICCPITKLCVTAGGNCTPSPQCQSTEYCCPDAKACLAPTFTKSVTPCSSDSQCGAGGVCCPLTKICVEVGAQCDPLK